ncbi:MAG: phage capsid protein [Bacteroidota bacterium]
MAVNKELWKNEVKEQLFADNEFLNTLKNADEYVVGGRIVHIPQSGGPSAVEKNRTTVPVVAVKRTDTDIVYPLHEYTTTPRYITNIDQVELSFDKTASVVREDTANLRELVAENILYDVSYLCPSGQKIATTGVDAAATAPGATGNRKIITEADIRRAAALLNKQNVPKNGRYMILSADMLDQLMSDDNLKYAFQQTVNISEGKLPRLFGFQLLERSSVLRVDAAQTVKTPDAAEATTDADTALFYQTDYLERAMGDINVFDHMGDPTYYGDVISFLVRAGSRACREDNKGYGIIYRDAA